MFAKSFRVKSNTVIKGSDRRKLKADITAAFPTLSADELSELIPNKEELNVVKIYAHKGDAVTLYVLHKNPLFFEVEKRLYPTVYLLWRYPDLLPTFRTWSPVLQKLIGGADLMLPGVVVPPGGLPDVKKGACCAVTVVNNRAPVAVGTAAVSSEEMYSLGMKGRGVSVLHTYMDHLWAFGDKSSPPSVPDEDCEEEMNEEECEFPEETEEKEEEMVEKSSEDQWCPSDPASDPACETMDALLLQCFLHALKSKVKKSELPLLTSTFLRNHMFSCCPSGKQIDLKKSSYKKLSKFLQTMQQQYSLVRVKELSKGVESIVEVDWKNPEKGATMHPAEVRSIITEYVKKNELVAENNKNYVTINPTLCDCLLEKSEYQEVESLKWDDLFTRTLGRMQECYQVVYPGQAPVIKKGHIEPIDISVASRGSNKKVTTSAYVPQMAILILLNFRCTKDLICRYCVFDN
uniref:DM2 domain-containing protein n=1 Tax=Salarias fasciatus TaxID=181472 RepID=A0A672HXE6_SALFA